MSFDYNFLNPDQRPPKNGWYTGGYSGMCGNCGKDFTGAKGAWVCADCAYDFDEQLRYEQLWRELGWVYTAEYVTRKLFKTKQEEN